MVIRLAVFSLLSVVSLAVQAFALGDVAVRSHVGHAFDAVIPFRLNDGESISSRCVRAHEDAFSTNQHIPLLADPRIEVVQTPRGGEIRIRSARPVGEPVLRLRLTIDCEPNAYIVREWIVLLDPPATEAPTRPPMAQTPAAPESFPVSVAPPVASPPRSARRARDRGDDENGSGTRRGATPQGEAPLRPRARGLARPVVQDGVGTALRDRVNAPKRPEAEARFRLRLSAPTSDLVDEPGELVLKRSDELAGPMASSRSVPPAEQEALRAEARIRLALDPFSEAVQLQIRLTGLEAGMLDMRGQVAAIDAARRIAEAHAGKLVEENRRLSDWLTGIAFALLFLLTALVLAVVIWRYRARDQTRRVDALRWQPDSDVLTQVKPQTELKRPAVTRAPSLVAGSPTAKVRRWDADIEIDPPRPPSTPVDFVVSDEGEVGEKGTAPEISPPLPADVAKMQMVPPIPPQPVRILPPGDQSAPIDFSFDLPESDFAATGAGAAADVSARAEVAPESINGDRSRGYLAEFELRMFPEIALGQVSLDDPRSIIVLARTYYQEDFDPGKAISFLEYTLHRAADSMRIYLALLEVLRMERRVVEYTTLARAFRGRYPASRSHWPLIAAYGHLLDPREPLFSGAEMTGLDLDAPSNWLGSTLDMTRYVLGQRVTDVIRRLPALTPGLDA